MDPMIAKNLRLLLMIAADQMRPDQKYYIQNIMVDGMDPCRSEVATISRIRADIARYSGAPLHMVTQ